MKKQMIFLTKISLSLIACLLIVFLNSCDDLFGDPDSNVIGGDGNLEQNKVGAEYGATFEIAGVRQDFEDSIIVTKNDNGNVELKAKIVFNRSQYEAISQELGFAELPENERRQLLDIYKNKFGFVIDTNNPNEMIIEHELKFRATSEGIQDYIYSRGDTKKPFTIIKYGDQVGSKYEFTENDGNKVIRTIIHKDEKESFPLVFWNIKITKVEEINNDPLLSKIVYYANHKFGLVGVEVFFRSGKTAFMSIIPWGNPNL